MISPVTHTADVAVNDEVINGVGCPLRDEIGRHKRIVPMKMRIIKPNKIILSGEIFLILPITGICNFSMSDTSEFF